MLTVSVKCAASYNAWRCALYFYNALDDHIVDAYSCIGLTTALYVASIVLVSAPFGRGEGLGMV